jgi:hypothetical protein
MRPVLERPDVLSLETLRPLGDLKLHTLAFLQALKATRLNSREMHKNVFATLTANEAVAFGVVESLHCSLFCHVNTGVPFNRFMLERFEGTEGRLLACRARTAHDRFCLTYLRSYAPCHLLQPESTCDTPGHDFLGFSEI